MSFPIRTTAAALALSLAALPAMAQDLAFTLSNQTSATLVEFYTSPADVGDWEADVFGSGVLGSGEAVTVTIADGRTQCVYDMKMVFDDGTELIDQADLCSLGSYTIHE